MTSLIAPAAIGAHAFEAHQRIVEHTQTIERLLEIKDELSALTGFDLFTSPIFMQNLMCHLFDLDPQEHRNSWDGLTKKGTKVEIKYAQASQYKRCGRWVFKWSRLQGVGNKGKNADVFLLVGYENILDERQPTPRLRFLVIPNSAVGNCDVIRYFIRPRRGRRFLLKNKWERFEVSIDQVKERLENAERVMLL